MKWWAIAIGVIGTVATLAVTTLLWLLVTHPVAVAQALAKGF